MFIRVDTLHATWHETAKTIPIWRRLRLVVLHSTENYIQLNINESPFNVGVPIELPEFTPQEVQTLAQKYGLDWEMAQVNQLMALVGGHPFLVRQACEYLQIYSDVTLEALLETADTEAGIYANYLRRYWEILQRHQESLQALQTMILLVKIAALRLLVAFAVANKLEHLRRLDHNITVGARFPRPYNVVNSIK